MKLSPHARAEVLAGAVALGEATDEERIAYRRHLAECAACLNAFGGEHELERLQGAVREAAASEMWEPDVRPALLARMHPTRRIARYGLAMLGLIVVVSLIGRFVVGSTFAHPSDPLVLSFTQDKVMLERRSTRDAKTPAPAQPIVIQHNIVHLQAAAPARVTRAEAVYSAPAKTIPKRKLAVLPSYAGDTAAQTTNSRAIVQRSNVPAWRSAIPARKPSYSTSIAPAAPARAELTIAPQYSTREPQPEAGETAIQPRPSAIAAEEGAEGTTAFEVAIDENGNPTKCTITMSSHYPVLDEATCNAAMKIHYRPKTLNGKALPGFFRDAFTFRPPEETNSLRHF
ncbi:MAG: TonB family protein [Candidatus Eremiobacteraeota bacterium]|nr:TonB family protein [Candidatus Eremiobacteraeota bacterium]